LDCGNVWRCGRDAVQLSDEAVRQIRRLVMWLVTR
jgi:hypothetical protein